MSRHFDIAAEFCELAGTPDLLEYLGLSSDADAEEAKAKLKARRKYMQGMQSNPKYRQEALFLIKHFAALNSALDEPATYAQDALRRAESVHLPILEMTVRGVLAGGALSAEQEAYLRRNAQELGVSDVTFDTLLDRLCAEAGVSRAGSAAEQRVATPATAPPVRAPGDDFWDLLGVPKGAPMPAIRTAYEQHMAAARARAPSPEVEALIVRLDLAWSVLSDPRARETYQIAQTRTAPPARQRQGEPPSAQDTAPPVRQRIASAPTVPPVHGYTPPGGGGSRLEVLGDPVRTVTIRGGEVTAVVRIRNGGNEAMTGRVSCDQPWVSVDPRQIDPNQVEQDIHVRFDGAAVPTDERRAVVLIQTDRGERVPVTFEIVRPRPVLLWAAAGSGALLLLLAIGWAMLGGGSPANVRMHIDPWAPEATLDGKPLGPGSVHDLGDLRVGSHRVTVSHPNFKPVDRPVTDDEISRGVVDIVLEQSRALTFKPADDMRRTSIPQDEASRVFGDRSASIDACIRAVAGPGQVLTGTVRVHIDSKGIASGMEVQGTQTDNPAVRGCLERQAAALVFGPLADGDYATVRYAYTVTASEPQ